MNHSYANLISRTFCVHRHKRGICRVLTILLLAVFFAAGCGKDEPEYIPGSSIQGYRAPISKVLFSPLAFDGATLAIEGFVVESGQEKDVEDVLTTFKLSDLNSNKINIHMQGQWDIENDDYMIVGGIYRRNGNILEAEQFETIEFIEKEKDKEIKKREEW